MAAIQLNMYESRQNRDAGIQKAVEHANQVNPEWSDKAYEMFVDWLKGWPSTFTFLMEDFRKVAQIRGLPDPPSARSFGGVALKAKFAGLIKSNGLKPTTSVTAHRCYANEWQKV